jgi:hypothetical protein
VRATKSKATKVRRIKPGQRVPISFSARERALVLNCTFADGELVEPLAVARKGRGETVVRYTLDDLDELLGYIAAEANHAKDKEPQAELESLAERLQAAMRRYDDGEWQAPEVTLGLPRKPK